MGNKISVPDDQSEPETGYSKTRTCPHLVIRGAVGGDKQIGHVKTPLSCTDCSVDEANE